METEETQFRDERQEQGPGEEYTGGDDVLIEEEDAGEAELTPEQQMIDNARELLGLNDTTPKDTFLTKVFRPLATAPLYPVKLVQVSWEKLARTIELRPFSPRLKVKT